MTDTVIDWMSGVSGEGWSWYLKYLSGNDTLLNGSHQAGPYMPKQVIFDLFPSLAVGSGTNPRTALPASVDSHGTTTELRAIWYNSRTRDECRLTGWGGLASPILDPDATGSLCVFAFRANPDRDADFLRIWLCRTPEEEDLIQDRTGSVEPGSGFLYMAGPHGRDVQPELHTDAPCWLRPDEIPAEWRFCLPDASSIIDLTLSRVPSARRMIADKRLLRRRQCEYEVFRSVEEQIVLPRIHEGFGSVDIFVDFANSVTNRRKVRSGASLELHLAAIFAEEAISYSRGKVSEQNKRPDFIFPSITAYHDDAFPQSRLRMLAAKTTCKDRWRQIINEANRIPIKYLVTLQEGVTSTQFNEMREHGVRLVVPTPLHRAFPPDVRSHLITLHDFIVDTRARCG